MNTINPIRELKAPPTLKGFAANHNLIASGNTTLSKNQSALLRKQIEDFEELPMARESAAELAARIENEEREVSKVAYRDISVADDMSLTVGENTLQLGIIAFKGLLRAIAPQGAFSYLKGVDPDLRAHNLRTLLLSDKKVKLRTRINSSGKGREIYAVTSEEYPDLYASEVLRTISRKTTAEARALYTYDPTTTQLSFKELLMKEIDPTSFRHGCDDVFQIGRGWSIKDDGKTSIKMNLLTFRQRCANMAMLSSDGYTKKVRHRGQDAAVLSRIDNLFAATGGLVEIFSSKWANARLESWHKQPDVELAMTAYGMLIHNKNLTPIGDKDIFAAALASTWNEEPGGTVADLVNGVTRWARTGSVSNSNKFGVDKLETEATQLMSLPARTWERTRKL